MSNPGPAAAPPGVVSVRRDAVSREIRLELADWRTRTGGVYDLSTQEQHHLLLDGHLPGWGQFLPDFVIVLATGRPADLQTADGIVETVVWSDLRVHVGGLPFDSPETPQRRGLAHAISAEWHSLDALLGRSRAPGAPTWLLDLIRDQTPWGDLLGSPPRLGT